VAESNDLPKGKRINRNARRRTDPFTLSRVTKGTWPVSRPAMCSDAHLERSKMRWLPLPITMDTCSLSSTGYHFKVTDPQYFHIHDSCDLMQGTGWLQVMVFLLGCGPRVALEFRPVRLLRVVDDSLHVQKGIHTGRTNNRFVIKTPHVLVLIACTTAFASHCCLALVCAFAHDPHNDSLLGCFCFHMRYLLHAHVFPADLGLKLPTTRCIVNYRKQPDSM
jgi:hypothetical protein